jgi:hypothetical protein
MNVMVSTDEPGLQRIDPPLQLNCQSLSQGSLRDGESALFNDILWTSTRLDSVGSRRKSQGISIATVNLGLEEKVGGDTFGLGRIDVSLRIPDLQPSC